MWPWSGGFGQYVHWATAEPIPYPPPAVNGSWDTYQRYASRFYSILQAQDAADASLRFIVGRTSSLPRTGSRSYADSPSIFAWELANEPRPMDQRENYTKWLIRQVNLVRELDENHLVTLGSEGETPYPEAGIDVVQDHRVVDFITVHVWPQNWGWYSPDPASTASASLEAALPQVGGYLARHLDYASVLSKPIVVEEFGLARDSSEIDGPAYHPNATDVHRQRLYDAVFSIVLDSLLGACQGADGSAHYSGVSFWGWAGVGRPRAPGGLWRPGDNLIGDPPHEPQGWYSVYDTDEDIGTLLTATASRMETMCAN